MAILPLSLIIVQILVLVIYLINIMFSNKIGNRISYSTTIIYILTIVILFGYSIYNNNAAENDWIYLFKNFYFN